MKSSVFERPVKEDTLYRSALGAFGSGDYQLCTQLIGLFRQSGRGDRGAWLLLAARCAKVFGDGDEWFASAQAASRECTIPGDRALGFALAAQAALRVSTEGEAAAFEAKALEAIAGRPPAEIGFARYTLGVYRYELADLDGAYAFARANLDDRVCEADSTALLGWIATRGEQYAAAARHFVNALRLLRASGESDARARSYLVSNIAVIASETLDLKLGKLAVEEFSAIRWSPVHHVAYDAAANAVRYLALLEGDVDRAVAISRAATAGTRPPAYQVIAEVMAAVASRLIGDSAAEQLQLRRAWDILRTERWADKSEEPRVALTYFMLEAADSLPAEARKASVLYSSLEAKWDPGDGFGADRRVTAFGLMGTARVAELVNDVDGAIAAYAASLEMWKQLGYHMRVAFAALALLRLTGRAEYRAIVRAVVARVPNAWFAVELSAKTKPVEMLTPAERVVLAHIIRGNSAREIATILGRSPFTVSNHTRKIFAAFGVNSREKVLARCIELGITSPSLERSARA